MIEEKPPLQQLFVVCNQCGTPNFTGVALRFTDLEQVRRSYRFGKLRCGQCDQEVVFSEGTLLPERELDEQRGAQQAEPLLNVQLTLQEIRIINNALNEVCNGVGLGNEFYSRMGCTVDKGRDLLAKVAAVLRNG